MNRSVIRNPLETEDTLEFPGLGLENIPVIDCDALNESRMHSQKFEFSNAGRFSYSTPEKVNNSQPISVKWSPKLHEVVTISEEFIEISSEEESRNDEVIVGDHTIFIDEDAVKQEELIDENAEESFENEVGFTSPRKVRDELNSSFDVNKVKREYNIKDNLCVMLERITNFSQTSISKLLESPTQRITRSNKAAHENGSTVISNLPNKSNSISNKSSQFKKSSSSKKSTKDDTQFQKSTNSIQRAENTRSRNKIRSAGHSRNKRHSLRLSGKSPEVIPIEDMSSTTRSGKKRVYETRNDKSEFRRAHNSSSMSVKIEPDSEVEEVPRSPSPSTYRRNVDVMYACVHCNQKYLSLDYLKAHIETHVSGS